MWDDIMCMVYYVGDNGEEEMKEDGYRMKCLCKGR